MNQNDDLHAFFAPKDPDRYQFFTREDYEAVTGIKDPVLEMSRPASLDPLRPGPYHFPEFAWPEELR